ncbi:MAG: MCE family protein [Phycisphaerales bacterium]|nr:MAG: MCE family protein [Phycisphaerales bacterium]
MPDFARNFVIGFVSIVALLGFAALLMFFGELDLIRTDRYAVEVRMNIAGGLRSSSVVELNGVSIGRVEKIELVEEDPIHPVRVLLKINHPHRIPKNVRASVEQSLLAGTAMLQLVSQPLPEGETELEYLPTDGSGQMEAFEQSLIDKITKDLDERTAPLLDALERFDELSRTYTALGENLNELVSPLTDDEDLNLRAAIIKLNTVLDEARDALALASDWLGDDQIRHDVREAVANAGTLIERATATFERYSELAAHLETSADEMLERLVPMADEMSATLAEVRTLVHRAGDGEGTIAQLLNNPDLYESLLDAAVRLDQALQDARLLIQKIKAEGLPVQF